MDDGEIGCNSLPMYLMNTVGGQGLFFCEHRAFTDESPFLADSFGLHFPFHLSTLRNKVRALWIELIEFDSV